MTPEAEAIRRQVAALPERDRRDLVGAITGDLMRLNDVLHEERRRAFEQERRREAAEERRRRR